MVDQHLLAALGIYGGENLDRKATATRCGHVLHESHHGLDGGLLIVLDADNDIADAKVVLHGNKRRLHILHTIQHGTGIRGDVGLALGAVDHQILNAGGVNVELYVGGESCAAQTHGATLLDGLQESITGIHHGRGNGLVGGHFPIGLNDDCGNSCAAGEEIIRDLSDLTRHGSMDGRRDKPASLSDEGADLDEIAHLHNRLCGGADVHGHRNHHRFGGIHTNGGHVLGILSVGHVYPMKERECHVLTTFLANLRTLRGKTIFLASLRSA